MIQFAAAQLKDITDAAETAYPNECCGLLAGREITGGVEVTRVVASDNVTESDHADSFEVDPQVRFNLMRELGEIGDGPRSDQRMIGHYHSHPDHPAEPSARDLEKAYEPDLIWVVASVVGGRTTRITAHRIDPKTMQFREIPVHTMD